MSRLNSLIHLNKGYISDNCGPMVYISRYVWRDKLITDTYPQLRTLDKFFLVETFIKLPFVLESLCHD